MKVINARKPISHEQPSIFLAGCTPRDKDTPSWRPDALALLEELRFEGVVIVPEDEDGGLLEANYDPQVRWEWEALDVVSCISFWIPRKVITMPGFTTNVEFGMYWRSQKVVVGGPDEAERNRYIQMLAERAGIEWSNNLKDLMARAVDLARYRAGAS